MSDVPFLRPWSSESFATPILEPAAFIVSGTSGRFASSLLSRMMHFQSVEFLAVSTSKGHSMYVAVRFIHSFPLSVFRSWSATIFLRQSHEAVETDLSENRERRMDRILGPRNCKSGLFLSASQEVDVSKRDAEFCDVEIHDLPIHDDFAAARDGDRSASREFDIRHQFS